MTKQEIRREKIAARGKLRDKSKKNEKIAKTLFDCDFYKKAQTIMVYISVNSEVDTRSIIEKMLADKKTLCAPVCIDKENMTARLFSDLDELTTGAYGIPEPQGEKPCQIDLIIVPGVAFNERLHRIGYGAGYYDRFLKKHSAVTCGLFYEMQKADFCEDATDKKLHYIITEENIYKGE